MASRQAVRKAKLIRKTWMGESIISVTVTDSITDRQTEAISTTIAAALGVLAVFFWVTVRQPALAFIAVGPIVLVLISVLGTMALLGRSVTRMPAVYIVAALAATVVLEPPPLYYLPFIYRADRVVGRQTELVGPVGPRLLASRHFERGTAR